jgi:DNA-binding beta-propeller fold protein YncE
MGAAPVVSGAETTDPYLAGQREVTALRQYGTAGVAGSGAGQFTLPRAVAAGADGLVYVADSGNDRVVVLGADGAVVRTWGTTCRLYEGAQGCQGDGRGQFAEPWGIAVGADGSVYVADTWNHRIQKFDREGNFLTMWGVFETTGGELGQPNAMYGPRAVVVGTDGQVYVMDTGNKRVQVFDPAGTFVAQYGGGGIVEGRFDEPVGLAQDAAGNWYVADTWNQRIQKFDGQFNYLAAWAVQGWGSGEGPSASVSNKPYLAVDGERGLLYATDPEGYRVLVFDLDGAFVGTWGLYGMDAQSFALPTGIAVAADGTVYVADGDAHRILVFPPFARNP